MANNPGNAADGQFTAGLWYAFGAFLIWGLAPLYFRPLVGIPAFEILAHRVAWSLPVVLILLLILRKPLQLDRVFRDGRTLATLSLTTLLISVNWFVFTWAVTHERVLETSLGYFINPLVSVLLGVVFLKEKLDRFLRIAVLLALAGVAIRILAIGKLPWVSLSLALSFACYGLLRKQVRVDALQGLLVETLFALPVAGGFIAYWLMTGQGTFTQESRFLDWMLIAGGVITTVPLALFSAGARRLPLYTVGMLQYLAPSLTFLLAIFAFREPFDGLQLISFVLIWLGLAVYTWDLLRQRRRRRQVAPAKAPD